MSISSNFPTSKKQKIAYFVTYPRSGHHILIKLLDTIAYITENYCEYYECIQADGIPINCPYNKKDWTIKLNKCGAHRQIIKSHDFDLNLPYLEENLFLIQLRNPILSIKSWYELALKDPNNKDISIDWNMFFDEKFNFWVNFVEKWIVHIDKSNVKYIPYNELGNYSKIESISKFLKLKNKKNKTWDSNIFHITREIVDDESGYLRAKEESIKNTLKELKISCIY